MPVVRIASEKPVEVLEPEPAGPLVEGAIRAFQPVRNQMVLAKPRRVVAIANKNVADGARTLGQERVVARIPAGELGDIDETDAVVVAPSQQSSPRGRAKSSGVK